MPSRTARQTRNVCTYAKVIYVDAIPDHLTISDVIGMGPGRPTWEQVRKMELIIEIREDGQLRVYDVSELGYTHE